MQEQSKAAGISQEFFSIPELATITDESPAVWRKRILKKNIGFTKCGRNVRVSRLELLQWLADRTFPACSSMDACARRQADVDLSSAGSVPTVCRGNDEQRQPR